MPVLEEELEELEELDEPDEDEPDEDEELPEPVVVAVPVEELEADPVVVASAARALKSEGNSVEQMGRTEARERIWGHLEPADWMELWWPETQELRAEE